VTATGTPAEARADTLRATLASNGPRGVVSFVQSLPDEERLETYSAAQRLFGPRSDTSASLDDYVVIVRAGIDDAIRRSEASSDGARAVALKETANIFSFNLLADLAECWPDDTIARERRHFEEGLRAAEDCIRWRDELGKPDDRKAMATWGKGMHLLSLGRHDEAIDAFRTTCALVFGSDSLAAGPESSFDQLLYLGYLGLARIAAGDAEGEAQLATARGGFAAQLGDDAKREDAQFGLDQLAVVERKIRAR
jgi:hypothetical protein